MWTGAEIRRRRTEQGFTQQQLADAIGASRRAVAAWEADESTPQGRFYNALERLLGDREPDEPEPPADEGVLLRDADFAQVLNRLIDLHNDAVRGGLNHILRVEDVPLPSDLPEHGVVRGPTLSSEPDALSAEQQPRQSAD
jgi:transcriptional regulator with XRE-family HTH domain